MDVAVKTQPNSHKRGEGGDVLRKYLYSKKVRGVELVVNRDLIKRKSRLSTSSNLSWICPERFSQRDFQRMKTFENSVRLVNPLQK